MFTKWIIKSVLLLAGFFFVTGCGTGYEQKNGKIFFNGKEITDRHFVVLNEVFAKDSLYAYYKEKSIVGADVASFTAVDNAYAKDKNRVYYCDEFREGQNYYLTKHQVVKVVDKALPSSFAVIEAGYAKDSLHGYYAGIAFRVKDPASLHGVDGNFAKDDQQVYFNGKPVNGSDGKSFHVLNDIYAADTAHIYYYHQPLHNEPGIAVLPCNRSGFVVLEYPYAKDRATVFYERRAIAGANPSSFTVLQHGFSKDSATVYFETKKINGADAASFEVFKENDEVTGDDYYARDKGAVFWQTSKLQEVNPAGFMVLGHGYGSNGKNIFYKTAVLKQADAKSFKVYPHDMGDADAEDAKNKFHSGSLLKTE